MDNNKKCAGCGVVLQDQNILQEGYTTSLDNDICQRCFKMKNYGEYQVVAKSNEEYLNILRDVGKTNDLVLYVTDLLNLEKDIEEIRTIIPNKMILVLNKKDVLPKSVKENKLIELTMSPLPSTTLNTVSIEINKYLTLIDTPGLVDNGSALNHVDEKLVKKISPKKEIKPRTYQLRKNQSIIIEDIIRIDYVEGEKNSFTLFVSNDLKVKRLLNLFNNDELKDRNKITYNMKYDEDLVISGLGFIKIVNKGTIDIYIDKNIDTYTRKSLI